MFALNDQITDEHGTTYRVAHEFPPGGQGFAFRVERVPDGARFVLKHLAFETDTASCERRTRMVIDADLGRRVSPALAAPLALVPASPGIAYVMPFVEGTEADALLDAAPWSLRESILVAAALAALLARLRDAGACHGDLSARNVALRREADGLWRVALWDLDNLIHARLPAAPMMGTPEYMPVEALRASMMGNSFAPTPQTENFALAVIVHEILRGTHPFIQTHGETPHAIAARMESDPRGWRTTSGRLPASALSAPVREMLDRGLSADPSSRPGPQRVYEVLRDAARDVYICTSCGAGCVNDAARTTCPSCGRAPSRPALLTNLGKRIELDRAVHELGPEELGWAIADRPHVRIWRDGFALGITDVSTTGTWLVGARGLRRLPRGEPLELRRGDRVRLGVGLELRVE